MHSYNSREKNNWQQIKQKGKLYYIVRWITYLFVFMLFVQFVLSFTAGRQFSITSLVAILLYSLIVGAAIAAIRWSMLERRYTNLSLSHHHHDDE